MNTKKENNWKLFKIIDVSPVSNKKIAKFEGKKKYIATGDLIQTQIKDFTEVTYDKKPSRADLVLSEGDVLFAKMQSTIKVIFGDQYNEDFIYSTGFFILSPVEKIHYKYIYYYLLSDNFNRVKDKNCTGATQKALTLQAFNKLQIPIPVDKDGEPDLAEQKRIVAILEEAEQLNNKREAANQKMEELIPALFVKMFGDPATNPMGWEKVPLSNLGTLDRGKSQHRPRTAPELFGGPYPFIQTGDVANAGWKIKTYSKTYSEVGLAQSKLWPKGTLCITIAANIADTAILDFEGCFPDSVVGFVPNESSNLLYVYSLFSFLKKGLELIAPMAAQKNINLGILRELKVPKPPIELQNEFADKIKDIEKQKEEQNQSADNINILFNAVMQKAFSGKL